MVPNLSHSIILYDQVIFDVECTRDAACKDKHRIRVGAVIDIAFQSDPAAIDYEPHRRIHPLQISIHASGFRKFIYQLLSDPIIEW